MKDILFHAAYFFGFESVRILGNNRKAELVRARHMIMKYMFDCGHFSTDIGRFMQRDHTTVLHACISVKNQVETDVVYRELNDEFVKYMRLLQPKSIAA